jgi:magnesium-transporting ATPase (P-type)
MEAAIDVLARRLGVDADADRARTAIRARFPFDPRRRRMSVVGEGQLIVKGAPEAVLPLCRSVDGASKVLHDYMAKGLRVIAIACRDDSRGFLDAEEAERDLTLLGLLALQDPPRTGARAAIEACRSAGIRVAMVTGDHLETAEAIAVQVGLAIPEAPLVTGDDLPSSDAALGAFLDHDGAVIARVSPEQKLRIARALRSRGHVVAMTGDGVNDGPALHEADIGVAMGASGTDVAREAADLVLLDDDFASIVRGVELGRGAYLNVRRFLTYHLTDNVAELAPFVVWALSGGRFPLALGVLQTLALDIGTDTLTAVALGAEPPARGVLQGAPVSGRLLNRRVMSRAFGVLGPTEALLALTAFVVSYLATGWRPGDEFAKGAVLATASGAAFLTVVLAQSMNAFACRSSTRPIREVGWRSNRLLPAAVAAGLGISLLAVVVGPIADELGHRLPSAAGWAVVVIAPVVLWAVDTLEKRRHRSSVRSGVRSPGARRDPRLPAR